MPKKQKKKKLTKEQKSAQEFTNTNDILNGFLYTKDGQVIRYVRIYPISHELLSRREKRTLTKQLSAELSVVKEPFHFLAVSRPVDVQPLLESYAELRNKTGNTCRRELLQKEMEYVSDFNFGNQVVERQFYFYLSLPAKEDAEEDLKKKLYDFAEHFEAVGIKTEILNDTEIIRLCNLVNNPAVAAIEDEMYQPTIPILKE